MIIKQRLSAIEQELDQRLTKLDELRQLTEDEEKRVLALVREQRLIEEQL